MVGVGLYMTKNKIQNGKTTTIKQRRINFRSNRRLHLFNQNESEDIALNPRSNFIQNEKPSSKISTTTNKTNINQSPKNLKKKKKPKITWEKNIQFSPRKQWNTFKLK